MSKAIRAPVPKERARPSLLVMITNGDHCETYVHKGEKGCEV